MLDWSQPVLAERAHISQTTLRNFEKGHRNPTHNNLAAIKSALEAAGVEFIGENGVTLKAAAQREANSSG